MYRNPSIDINTLNPISDSLTLLFTFIVQLGAWVVMLYLWIYSLPYDAVSILSSISLGTFGSASVIDNFYLVY
jgi:hypothetical protein